MVSEKEVEAAAAALERLYRGPHDDTEPFALMARAALEAASRVREEGAVAWRIEGVNITDDPARAEGWRHLFKGPAFSPIQPLYLHPATSREDGIREAAEAVLGLRDASRSEPMTFIEISNRILALLPADNRNKS